MTQPLVDVAVGTYNHASFVVQALDSVLAQKTTFDVRLIVADDCSTDGTQDILRSYQRKYRDQVDLLLDTVHRGLSDPKRAYVEVLKRCSAKYVALLEGDDYWTDALKLRKQVAFLETHPEFVMCGHNVRIIGEGELSNINEPYFPDPIPDVLRTEDFIRGIKLPTNSLLFRRRCLANPPMPPWMRKVRHGDKWLYTSISTFGLTHYDPSIQGVYRKHSGGAVGGCASWSSAKRARVAGNDVYFWRKMRKEVGKFDADFRNRIAAAAMETTRLSLDARMYAYACFHSLVALTSDRSLKRSIGGLYGQHFSEAVSSAVDVVRSFLRRFAFRIRVALSPLKRRFLDIANRKPR